MKARKISRKESGAAFASSSKDCLEIGAGVFGDETAYLVIDEWIVPVLVEEFLARSCEHADPISEKDNGGLL
jgi:hypothetical protein